MKRWNRYALSLVMALAVSGCCEMEYYEVPVMPGTDEVIENPTQLKVITHEESTETENLNVYLFSEDDGEMKATFESGSVVDVESGTYLVLKIVEHLEELTESRILTLPVTSARTASGYVSSAPEVHAGHGYVQLSPNEYHECEIKVNSYTRDVKVSANLLGITKADVASVRFELTGVNNEVDLLKDFGDEGGSGSHTLAGDFPSMQTDADGNLLGEIVSRVIGLDLKNGNHLTIIATLADGSTQSVTFDVTKLLSVFYSLADDECITLNASLSFGIDGMTGSIEGWTPGWNEDVSGN